MSRTTVYRLLALKSHPATGVIGARRCSTLTRPRCRAADHRRPRWARPLRARRGSGREARFDRRQRHIRELIENDKLDAGIARYHLRQGVVGAGLSATGRPPNLSPSRSRPRMCGSTRPTTRCARTSGRRMNGASRSRQSSPLASPPPANCMVLGVDCGPSEDHVFWTHSLRALVKRGLKGVQLDLRRPRGTEAGGRQGCRRPRGSGAASTS